VPMITSRPEGRTLSGLRLVACRGGYEPSHERGRAVRASEATAQSDDQLGPVRTVSPKVIQLAPSPVRLRP
jgi:hypothetical protein